MKKLAVFLFLLWAIPARATIPNSYAVQNMTRYDLSVGTAGTAYVTVSFTGAMQFNPGIPCQTLHTPKVSLKQNNGTWLGPYSGTPTQACSNMAWSYVFALDLNSMGCTLDVLQNPAGCTIQIEAQIFCPMMGLFFEENFLVGIEWAWTRVTATQCIDLSKGTTQCKATYYCQGGSVPPDYQPTRIVANIPSGLFPPFWLAGAVGFRIPNSVGVPWHFPFSDLAGVVPGDQRWKQFLAPAVPWNGGPFVCTLADKDLGTILPWPF